VHALEAAKADVAMALSPVLAKPEKLTRETELDDGQTFAELLSDAGVPDNDAAAAMNALAKVYDLRDLQAGQDVTLLLTRTGVQEAFDGAIFQPSATQEISIARKADGTFNADVKTIPIERRRLAAQGEIRSSLYEAGDRAGVPHAVMASLIHIYAHDIDFQRDIHSGDRFEVLYDQPTTAQGKAVGEGTIIYAAIHVGNKVKPIYRVTFSDNTVDYFDERGQSTRRAILRTPVAAAHITSGFGMRVHPLLGYSKMHKGVDFGAPIGTPIFAAGAGTIEEIGFKNGFGRYIKIRHTGQLENAYGHMSRFGGNMYRGAHVNQGEVIAYVGMSGRATGPHLHFEVHINGQQVNPMSVNLPTGRSLDGRILADFRAGQGKIRQQFYTLLPKTATNDTAKPAASPAAGGVIPAAALAPAYPAAQPQNITIRQ
jgi:murein DD-endopeptidase MepM/ murein hydrolase activator NlpD